MRLSVGCEITFACEAATPMILMLRPRSGHGQWVAEERYTLSPSVPAVEYVDAFGNLCQRLLAPQGAFVVSTDARVDTADAIDVQPGAPPSPIPDLPDGVLHFLLPSRYCQSDQLGARALEVTAGAPAGYDQAAAIGRWIHEHVEYKAGSSDASTSARETLERGQGVCRDFAHLGMALCRAISLPARMVVGYLHRLEPMDLHAWYEVYVAGRWYTFDPTQAEPRGGRVTVAYGRDAADVALATQFGPAPISTLRVWVNG